MIVPPAVKLGMITAYSNGMTQEEAAKSFGYSRSVCDRALINSHITRRSRSQTQRRHALDESFFDQIDTETKAYWLGFITADGNIANNGKNRTRNQIILQLQPSDISHITKLRAALKSSHPIRVYYGYPRITINSKRLAQALIVLGVTPNKSLTISPCTKVPCHLLNHYWRGVIDGDGCIGKAEPTGKFHITLVGSQMMINGFVDYVKQFVISRAIPHLMAHSRIWRVKFHGTNLPLTILQLLYKDASIGLDRKYKLAMTYLEPMSCRNFVKQYAKRGPGPNGDSQRNHRDTETQR